MEQYDFEIKREPLFREDKTDTQFDCIYRTDTGLQLGLVSRQYQLITHKEAVDFITSTLNESGVNYDPPKIRLINEGRKMDCEILFPSMRFPVEVGDEFDPKLILQNSYDAEKSFGVILGVHRLVCSNGAVVFSKDYRAKIRHAYTNVRWDMLKKLTIQSLNQITPIVKDIHGRLIHEDGSSIFKRVVQEDKVSNKVKELMISDLGGKVEGLRNAKGKIISADVNDYFSSYELWNVLTSISTHHYQENVRMQRELDLYIRKCFFK